MQIDINICYVSLWIDDICIVLLFYYKVTMLLEFIFLLHLDVGFDTLRVDLGRLEAMAKIKINK